MFKRLFKILKKILMILILSVLILITTGLIWYKTSPQFGGEISELKIKEYKKTGHFKEGVFINKTPVNMDMPALKMFSIMIDFIIGNPKRNPSKNIDVIKINSTKFASSKHVNQITWFGHSSILLELDKHIILIDPMLGNTPSPLPILGPERYSKELPITIEELPYINAVIISHDHYDHLDYESIKKLKKKANHFYVPLGVDAHLIEWGIDTSKITALNWWESAKVNEINLVFTPSRHFSGRGLGDRFSTLWGSWVIKGKKDNIFFSGDGGYGPHFKEIGKKLGPFDFSMIECGQYNENWSDIHMMPEESVRAAKDLNSSVMMPIHWGAFSLSLHDWTDPVERVINAANNLKIPISTPKIGEALNWRDEVKTFPWWKSSK